MGCLQFDSRDAKVKCGYRSKTNGNIVDEETG